MVDQNQTAAVDAAVKAAKNLPGLVQQLNTIDPTLVQAFTGKALVASKSVYGPALVGGVSYLAGKYGLGWSPDFCAGVAGGLVLVASAALRFVTSGPITGLFRKKALPAPAK